MADVLRSCAKTGCRWPAAASLSYRYATRQVWLLDLSSAPDPSLYDLCPHHADHLVVPKGWERVDDRTAQEVMVEPSAFDRAEQAARRRITAVEPPPRYAVAARPQQLVGAAAGRNRYSALVEQLPKLAAEQGRNTDEQQQTSGTEPQPPPPAAPTAAAPPGPLADRRRGGPTTGAGRPVPAGELAPMAADEMPPAPADAAAPPGVDEAVPGQLSIPVDDAEDTSSGVVLPFDLAGGRRRGKSS